MKMWLGEGGIRTLGALLGHGALAKLCFQPLSHLTKSSAASENMAENCRLPTLVVDSAKAKTNATLMEHRYSPSNDQRSRSAREDFAGGSDVAAAESVDLASARSFRGRRLFRAIAAAELRQFGHGRLRRARERLQPRQTIARHW